MASRWHPKTVTSARLIPFDLCLRLELCLERFASRYEEFPRSRSTVNRRIQNAADLAGLPGLVYPHWLRATAASHHAYKGVAPVPLQALLGWSDLATAQKYIRIPDLPPPTPSAKSTTDDPDLPENVQFNPAA